MMLAIIQETKATFKSQKYSHSKLQWVCEGKVHFISACPCTSKHLSLLHYRTTLFARLGLTHAGFCYT
jgi:hypothetical protein